MQCYKRIKFLMFDCILLAFPINCPSVLFLLALNEFYKIKFMRFINPNIFFSFNKSDLEDLKMMHYQLIIKNAVRE